MENECSSHGLDSHVWFESEHLDFVGSISSAPGFFPPAVSVLVCSHVLSHHGRTIL